MQKSTNSPFSDLKKALNNIDQLDKSEPPVRIDTTRLQRTGIPEVVLAQYKPIPILLKNMQKLIDANGRVLVYKCQKEKITEIIKHFSQNYDIQTEEIAQAIIVSKKGYKITPTGGKIAILSAGSSDIPVAIEAALMAEEMGVAVTKVWDVGVAGLHKLILPLTQITQDQTRAIIIAAGMDAALFTVVCGLVNIPVIGLPTSVGNGYAGQGQSALGAMLQSCAPGGAVVNIDNGIGAGAIAARIANQIASQK
jgi:NCAIR mutase (PurE)-related protein